MTLDLQTVLALLTVAAAFLFLARGTVRTARSSRTSSRSTP